MGRTPSLPTVSVGIIETSDGTIDLTNDWERWQQWLESANSFRYIPQSSELAFTIRKEQGTKGKASYWYAYRKESGKLAKCYAGLDEGLTIENLEAIASQLTQKLQGKVTEKPSVTKVKVTESQSVTNDEIEKLQRDVERLQSDLQVALGK